jgi:hypothetical protein
MLGPAGYVRFSRNWAFPIGRNYDRNAATTPDISSRNENGGANVTMTL